MKLEVSLSPTGDIRLHIPTAKDERTLDISATDYGAMFLQRILKDAASGRRDQPGYIGQFPTQAVLDAWAKEFKRRRQEASVEERREELLEKHGVDIDKVEFEL